MTGEFKALLFHGLHCNSPCNYAILPIVLETESRVVDAVEVDIKKDNIPKGEEIIRKRKCRSPIPLRDSSDIHDFFNDIVQYCIQLLIIQHINYF